VAARSLPQRPTTTCSADLHERGGALRLRVVGLPVLPAVRDRLQPHPGPLRANRPERPLVGRPSRPFPLRALSEPFLSVGLEPAALTGRGDYLPRDVRPAIAEGDS